MKRINKKIIFILSFAFFAFIFIYVSFKGSDKGYKDNSKQYVNVSEKSVNLKLIPKDYNIYRKISDNLLFRTGVNSDLLFAASSAGGRFKNPPSYLSADDKYGLNKKFKTYFLPYCNSTAAKMIYEAAISMDNPPKKFVGPILHDILKYDDDMLYSNSSQSEEVFNSLERFSQDSEAADFFAKNHDLYNNMINDFVNQINFDYIKRLEDFFGEQKKNAKFTVVLSTVMDGGQAAYQRAEDGSIIYYNIMNPSQGKHYNLLTLYHETAHNFYDVIERRFDLVESYSKYRNALGNNENNFGAQLNETITRAVTAVLLEKYHPDLSADKDLIEFENKGYKNLYNIYKLIKNKYMPDRIKYKTFDSFVPVIFEYIKALSLNEPFDID